MKANIGSNATKSPAATAGQRGRGKELGDEQVHERGGDAAEERR